MVRETSIMTLIALTISGGTTGDYTYENGVVTFLKGGEYTISMAPGVTETSHQIRVNVAGVYPSRSIKLILSGLNMKRDAGPNIDFFNIQESYMEISAEFVLDGENKITNSGAESDDRCIREERVNIDYIVSGSGSLTLKSDRARDWNPRTLTLDSEDAEVILDITAMTAYWLQIKAGTLDITTNDINLTIAGDMLMTGGTLKMKNTSGGSCINLLGTQPKKLGAGVEISGGEVTLEATGQGSTGIISINTAADKDLLIKGSAAVTIHGNGMRPAAILIRQDGNDFVIENGTLRSDGTQTGIYKGTEGSKVYFKGGTTELTTSVYALYQVTADSLIFDSGYDHKNFMGSSAETRVETADNGIISNGKSGRYLLITPVYSITYELNGGSLPEGTSNPVSYLPTDLPIALTDPVLENNTFLGWTGSGADTPTTPFTIPAGTSGDLTYTANWRQDFFSVSSLAGAGIVKTDDSGPAKQTVSNGEAMTTIVYNSDDGHYFPEDYSVPSVNEISVTRISETEINISGTPTADTVIILPDAEKRTEKEPTPAAIFTATGPDSGVLSGLEPGAEYTITGLLPEAYTFTAAGTEQKLSGVSPETITIVRKGYTPDTDSDPQSSTIPKAGVPDASASDCTTADNNDGRLSGVTEEMEYRRSDSEEWESGTGSVITGLEPGIYFVRVKAEDSTLASENQILTIRPYTPPVKPIIASIEFESTYDGKAHGITLSAADPASGAVIKYGTSEGSYTLDDSPAITDVSESPFTVYYQITADDHQTLTGSAVIIITKEDALIKTLPTANDRSWDGTDQPLLNSDGTASGGTLYYALGTDPSAIPAADQFSTMIPSETDAGTYYVWCKVVGDENHNDSEPVCRDITVAEPLQYTVTIITDGNGTASADPASGPAGTTVTLTAAPADGYRFKGWKVIYGNVNISGNQLVNKTSEANITGDQFTIGDSDVVIEAVFEKSASYQVTVITYGDGTASADTASGPAGTTVTLTAAPADGYRFKEWKVLYGGVSITGDQFTIGDSDVIILAAFEKITAPCPICPGPYPHPYFYPFAELPPTGITSVTGNASVKKPASVNYDPIHMELLIPGLDITSEIVRVPKTEEGYAVQWLGDNAGLLDGFDLPGKGISVIAAHNTLNAEDFGPFASIRLMEEGDHLMVRQSNGKLMSFKVYANTKIGAADMDGLLHTAAAYENTITLLTCEDELPEGGYASRRIVSARLVE